jgi:hypothetical protein
MNKKKPVALLALLCCLLLSMPAFATISITGLRYASANSTCDGEIEVTVTGNAGPFQLQLLLRNQNTVLQQSGLVNGKHTFKGLCKGDYDIKVYNALQCIRTLQATMDVCNPNWDIEGTVTRACYDVEQNFYFENGAIDINITGNGFNPPLQYWWSNGEREQDLAYVKAGDYGLIVTDKYGCKKSKVFTVPKSSITLKEFYIGFNNQGKADIWLHKVETTHPSLTYLWSTGATTKDLQNVIPATYTVTITNGMGCTYSKSFQPQNCAVKTLKAKIHPLNTSVDQIFIETEGGNPPLKFKWSGPNGFTSAERNPQIGKKTGEYCVTVTDACQQGFVFCTHVGCGVGSFPHAEARKTCFGEIFDEKGKIEVEFGDQNYFENGTTCDDKFYFRFSDGSGFFNGNEVWIERTAAQGDYTHRIDKVDGTYCVEIKNECGCSKVSCWPFAHKREAFSYSPGQFKDYIPGYITGNYPLIVQCLTCDMCNQNPPSFFYAYQCNDNDPEWEKLVYVPPAPGASPCQGGRIYCQGMELQVPSWAIGQEIVKWDEPPVRLDDGRCKYKSGCLFPPGLLPPPVPEDYFVYVDNDAGHIVPATEGLCPGAPDPDPVKPECNGVFIIDPQNPYHPNDKCLYRYICVTDPSKFYYFGVPSLICKCSVGDVCSVFEICWSGTHRIECESNETNTLLSNNCEDYEEDHGAVMVCPGFSRRPGSASANNDTNAKIFDCKAIPNPFDDEVALELSVSGTQEVQIILLNNLGQIMESPIRQEVTESGKFVFNTKLWQNGLYYFSVRLSAGTHKGIPVIKTTGQ